LYFGDAIALYFTFLSFYTTALLIPTVLGFVQLALSTESIAFFGIFNVLWVTVFLEVSTEILEHLSFVTSSL
jgi:anoctamin-10